jgi:2-iminobutanoate/2-iminopropanoate deaminase
MRKTMIKRIETKDAPTPIGPYSQAVVGPPGELCFTSGQVGNDPGTGRLVAGGIEAETERALSNLEAVLAAGGLRFSDVVRVTIFLVDLGDFAVMNAIYARRLGGHCPARSTVQVAALPLGARVEIDMLAVRPTGPGA